MTAKYQRQAIMVLLTKSFLGAALLILLLCWYDIDNSLRALTFQLTMARANGFIAFVFLAFVLTVVQADVMYTMENTALFDSDKYKLSWAYKSAEEKVYFKVVVNTTGWVGLGFSDVKGGMQNLDCVVGGVDSGAGYLMDLKATEKNKPAEDAKNDYQMKTSSESNGQTMLEFGRKVNTEDANDMQFMAGTEVYVAWAYFDSADAPNYAALTVKHSNKGYGNMKLVFVPANMNTTMASNSTMASTMASTTAATTTSQGSHVNGWIPGIFLLFVLLSLFQ